MGNKGLVYFVASLLWVGCGSPAIDIPNGSPKGDLSKPVRPTPAPTPGGGQGEFYIHPVTKQPFDGVFDVVKNGERLKIEIKAGWKTGLYQRWYPNSKKLKSEWNLVKNQRHGLQRDWYPNGQLRLEANFDKGILLNGKTWRLSGEVASKVIRGTGSLVLFHTDGSKNRESIYKEGLKVGD